MLNQVQPHQDYLNLFGSGVDEQAEREKAYQEAKLTYPVDQKFVTCENISIIERAVQLAIDGFVSRKANDSSAGNIRVMNRYIDGYTKWLNEVKVMYQGMQCEKKIADQEAKEFFDTQYTNLEKVQQLSEDTGSGTKYLIFGMLGLVVLVSGVIIFKKK